jgi:hypothetical protein
MPVQITSSVAPLTASERAAGIYSLLGTAQLNGLNIEAYATCLSDCPNIRSSASRNGCRGESPTRWKSKTPNAAPPKR